MDAFPELDVYYDESMESTLVDELRVRSTGLWQPKIDNPLGNPAEDGEYCFHRNKDDIAPACTVCLRRKKAGHLYVSNVTPDAYGEIPHEQIVAVIREFDTLIAAPASEAVDGMTSVGTDKHTLEDYFSSDSIGLLESFCKTSNAGDLGNHESDQRKWRAFLLHVFRNEKERVSGDVFGRLLRPENWWPDPGIRRLANQYNFAMALLSQAEGN